MKTVIIMLVIFFATAGQAARILVDVSEDNYVFGNIGSTTKNWGAAITLRIDNGIGDADYKSIYSFDKAAFSGNLTDAQLAVIVVTSCSLIVPVTVVTTAGDVGFFGMWKPAKWGAGNGVAATTNEMAWAAWSENGTTDSTWGTAGIGTASDAGSWNRTIGGNDRKSTAEGTLTVSATGTHYFNISTNFVESTLRAIATDQYRQLNFVAMAISEAGADITLRSLNDTGELAKPGIIINYTLPVTLGFGRHGIRQNGEYGNNR